VTPTNQCEWDHSHGFVLVVLDGGGHCGVMALIALSALGGAASGVLGGSVLSRLRRGCTVHSGWSAAAVGVLWAVAAWRVASGQLPLRWLPVPLAAAWFAVPLAVVDLRHRRLPDALTLPAYPVIGLVVIAAGDRAILVRALVGAVVYLAVHLLVHAAAPGALGAGDVKLSGSVGAALGASGLPSLVAGAVLAAVGTLLLGAASATLRRDGIPHGPGLLAAMYVLTVFPTAVFPSP
jgi:leader peptidase (prepilin peptidase) / N-methyltransferase